MFQNSALSATSSFANAMQSADAEFELWYQNNGDVSLIHINGPGGPPFGLVWQSDTTGLPSLVFGLNPAQNGPALYDGSLNSKPVWSESGITVSGLPYRWFVMQNDGNFVLYASSDPSHHHNVRAIWDTGTANAA